MNTLLRNRLPVTIPTEEEFRQLWADFKTYMKNVDADYTNPQNQNDRLTGAGLFVDFLCGIKPKPRDRNTSYLQYPEKPWPL